MGDENKSKRGKRRRRIGIPYVPNTVLLLVLVLGTTLVLLLRGGYIPARYSPTATIDMNDRNSWFVDWRLGELKRDRPMCDRLMKTPMANVSRVSDAVRANGCGWQNAFRVKSMAGASVGGMRMTCPMAVGMTMWMTHVVQPAAKRLLGSRVTRLKHFGGYNCRKIKGGRLGKFWPRYSEHAFANAIDISGFQLAKGGAVSVLKHWKSKGAKGQFVREVHAGACKYMSMAIGPRFNSLHADHFHYDRGFFFWCK